jgi:hypothetical protein
MRRSHGLGPVAGCTSRLKLLQFISEIPAGGFIFEPVRMLARMVCHPMTPRLTKVEAGRKWKGFDFEQRVTENGGG